MAGVLAIAAGPEMVPIFNGKNWNSWDLRGQANYQIADGAIVGTTGKGGHGWLCTTKTYGDFILDAVDLDDVIALQVHGGQNGDVWFKDIEILDDAK